jgi:hypothetical protein
MPPERKLRRLFLFPPSSEPVVAWSWLVIILSPFFDQPFALRARAESANLCFQSNQMGTTIQHQT